MMHEASRSKESRDSHEAADSVNLNIFCICRNFSLCHVDGLVGCLREIRRTRFVAPQARLIVMEEAELAPLAFFGACLPVPHDRIH